MGGKPKFGQATRDAIISALEQGKSLRAACLGEGMPTPRAVLDWVVDDPEGFGTQYARAREVGYLLLADELLAISDDGTGDTWTDEDGNERTNQDVIARSRLRVDTRKWMLSKMLPKVYGEKLDVAHSGGVSVKMDSSDDKVL